MMYSTQNNNKTLIFYNSIFFSMTIIIVVKKILEEIKAFHILDVIYIIGNFLFKKEN